VTTAFAIDEFDLARLLQSLVRVPTVNPPGDEALVAPLIADRLRRLGCDVQIIDSEPGRANIVAVLHGDSNTSQPAFYTTSSMADEYVELSAVARAARIYATLIHNLLG
jgi:acetylornithine deacetylase/succinyl-diaminopimelate desuccinylase-like protein